MYRPQKPISYLITSGQTTSTTTSNSKEFENILQLIEAAVAARIDLIQVREKDLTTRVLYQLVRRGAELTRNSATKLLVNDRADVASSSGADGVHLTARSLPTSVVRQAFGNDLLIGVSTHSLDEVRAARDARADFVVLGPVFQTPSKEKYGSPLGLERLKQVCLELNPFPVLAIGGVTENNFADCLRAGAQGVAAIRMFAHPQRLSAIVRRIREDSY